MLSQQRNFRFISRKLVRRFKNHRKPAQCRVLDDAVKRLETKIAFPEPFVPVLVRGNRIFAVVEMQRAKSGKADLPVKFL